MYKVHIQTSVQLLSIWVTKIKVQPGNGFIWAYRTQTLWHAANPEH